MLLLKLQSQFHACILSFGSQGMIDCTRLAGMDYTTTSDSITFSLVLNPADCDWYPSLMTHDGEHETLTVITNSSAVHV